MSQLLEKSNFEEKGLTFYPLRTNWFNNQNSKNTTQTDSDYQKNSQINNKYSSTRTSSPLRQMFLKIDKRSYPLRKKDIHNQTEKNKIDKFNFKNDQLFDSLNQNYDKDNKNFHSQLEYFNGQNNQVQLGGYTKYPIRKPDVLFGVKQKDQLQFQKGQEVLEKCKFIKQLNLSQDSKSQPQSKLNDQKDKKSQSIKQAIGNHSISLATDQQNYSPLKPYPKYRQTYKKLYENDNTDYEKLGRDNLQNFIQNSRKRLDRSRSANQSNINQNVFKRNDFDRKTKTLTDDQRIQNSNKVINRNIDKSQQSKGHHQTDLSQFQSTETKIGTAAGNSSHNWSRSQGIFNSSLSKKVDQKNKSLNQKNKKKNLEIQQSMKQLNHDNSINERVTESSKELIELIKKDQNQSQKKLKNKKKLSAYQQRIFDLYEQLQEKTQDIQILSEQEIKEQIEQVVQERRAQEAKQAQLEKQAQEAKESFKKNVKEEEVVHEKKERKQIKLKPKIITKYEVKQSDFASLKTIRNETHSAFRTQSIQAHSKPAESCLYHSFKDESPFRTTVLDSMQNNEYSPGSKNMNVHNISQQIIKNPQLFEIQSELYKNEHRMFQFNAAKCKVGSRADRVYSYYAYDKDWRRDRYLRVSQESDHKTLQSREGRKLELQAYYKKMALRL